MFKILVLFFGCFLFPTFFFAQIPNWQWGENGNCATDDKANVIAHDKAGNLYVAGLFTGIMQLDTFMLNSMGGNDVFIAKYANNGTLLWAKSGGSNADETVRAITIDTSGNIYMTGSFGGHIIYPVSYTDTAYFSDSSIVSKANMDIYLISYTPNGNIRWLRDYGSKYNDVGKILTCNQNNQIIFSGEFSRYNGSPPIYDSLQIDNTMLYAINGESFIIKMSVNANVQNCQQFKIDISGLSIVKENKPCIISYIGFGSTTIDNVTISSISAGTVNGGFAIIMLDSSFHAIWGKVFGGQNSGGSIWGEVNPISIAYDGNTGVYFLGSYKECSLIIQNAIGLQYELTFHNILAKLDTNGQLQWIKSFLGYSDFDAAESLYLDENQNVFLAGYFKYKGYFENDTLLSTGVEDAFIAKYDSLGTEQWAMNMGGNNTDEGIAITGTDDGSLYVSGLFYSSVFSYQGHSISNTGGSDLFVAKLSQTTGISNEKSVPKKQNIQIFPNPATNEINVAVSEGLWGEGTLVTAYDLTGRRMVRVVPESNHQRVTLNSSTWASGVYLITAQRANGELLSGKAIIEK